MRYRWGAALLSVCLFAAVACGDEGPDHGEYALVAEPGDYDEGPNRVRGTLVESLRLGERVIFADRIDPELTEGNGGGPVVGVRGVDDLLSGAQRAALEPFDVLAGFGAIGGNGLDDNESKNKFLSITVLSLPGEAEATSAAQAMAAADFAATPDNAPIALPEYPAALTHWRPGVPTVGSWSVWKNLVVRIFAKIVEPNSDQLADLLTRTYRAQLAELETFTPTAAAEVPGLKLDPDSLLPRVVKTDDYWPDRWNFTVFGPHSFALLNEQPSARLRELETNRVDAIAVSYNKFLYRTADSATAEAFAEVERQRMLSTRYDETSGVADLSGVSCFRATRPAPESVPARRFACLVRHAQFVVLIHGNQEIETRRQAVAQYALLGGTW
ncbi:hypothetical protein FNL39_1011071 [Nocardia caishijiensis]|uniref:Uncharacterized protein n=1 Tax=Nocardia caishijiensis TaxID=184756 RepID=A0ABQ6YV07_9NOCA|nr:hypothetical protein FNL39_1011071 [Nocardia caishijiensis]